MPTTRWANTALERVSVNHAAVVDMLAEYGASDLLCYRAEGPEGLVAKQAEAWDPPLAWARDSLDAQLIVTTGITPVVQPAPALQNLTAALASFDALALTAVHDAQILD